MAKTTGLVQKVKLNYELAVAWVYVGPTATDTDLFYLPFRNAGIGNFVNSEREAAFLGAMLDQLFACMLAQREVTVYHDDDDSTIGSVEVSVTGGLMPP